MPIRLRLALWYGGLTGVIVVLVCLVIYTVHTRAHYDDLDRVLSGAAEHVSEEYTAAQTARERDQSMEAPTSPDVEVRVYGQGGRLLAESPNASPAPQVDPRAVLDQPSGPPYNVIAGLAPPLVAVDADGGEFGLIDDFEGGRWRLFVLPMKDLEQYLVAAAPLDRIDASAERLRQLVALLAVIAAAVALATGALLASRALRPVATLTATADSIARSRDFSKRVPAGTRRDELGRLAETFNDMLTGLERAYQAERRFVADASHELRAPLTAIQGNLELLSRHPDKAPAEQHEALSEANRETQRLSQLVADLLALARADAGMSLRRQRVELDRVLLDSLAQVRHLACGQRVEVEALEPALVEGDPDRLKELLLILLDNALKYTPSDGKVTLSLTRNSATAEVAIHDTGIGISPDDLPRVFDRFYRADPARVRDPGGTGLGLSIARWIAEQHDGEIELESKPDRGTSVSVRLPLHP